jgi:hypothetical protein
MKQVWYLWQEGERLPSLWFDTKETAEAAARMLYPDESESKRYQRVFYRDVLTLKDLHGG